MIVAPGSWLDSTSWFLGDDSKPTVKPLGLQERQAPQLAQWDDETVGNGVRYFKFVARRALFPCDWRLVIQGNT
jgi:hypothetical protein